MLPLPFRPRSAAERLSMTGHLLQAPDVIGLPDEQDGWAAACLSVAGRAVRLPPTAVEAEALLAQLGLPGPERRRPSQGELRADLRRSGKERRGPLPGLPPAPRGPGTLGVSVVICTYNRRAMLEEAIASVLVQGWPAQLIVVDDGSTDDTPAALAQIAARWPRAGPSLRLLRLDNGGKSRALNHALPLVTEDSVLVFDDDDVLLPGALRVLATALAAAPEAAAALGDLIAFQGPPEARRAVEWRCSQRAPGDNSLAHALIEMPAFPGSTLMRTAALRDAGPYDEGLLRLEDLDMAVRLARVGPNVCVPLPTLLYRLHAGLRGPAAGRVQISDQQAHDAQMRPVALGVLRRQAAALGPSLGRSDRVALSIGLSRKGDPAAAAALLGPLEGPFTQREQWARANAGLEPGPLDPGAAGEDPLLIVDDGGEGALELSLSRLARRRPLYLNFTVPREPIADLQIHWQGVFVAEQTMGAAWPPAAQVELGLSSRPGWSLPAVRPATDLLPLPPVDAVLALAACRGAVPPAEAPGLRAAPHPLTAALLEARAAPTPAEALGRLQVALSITTRWAPLWRFVAEQMAALGDRAGSAAALHAAHQLDGR